MPSLKCSIALLTASILAVVDVAVGCRADNCYRALFPCPSPDAVSIARDFCATITAGGTTATNYPTRATSACGLTPDRYISACQCGPTCSTATPPATESTTPITSSTMATPSTQSCLWPGLVGNGGFECDQDFWDIDQPSDPKMHMEYSTDMPFSGLRSMVVYNSGTGRGDAGYILLYSLPLDIMVGTTYKLTFQIYSDNNPQGVLILDAAASGPEAYTLPNGGWLEITKTWTRQATEYDSDIHFGIFLRAGERLYIDNVVLEAV